MARVYICDLCIVSVYLEQWICAGDTRTWELRRPVSSLCVHLFVNCCREPSLAGLSSAVYRAVGFIALRLMDPDLFPGIRCSEITQIPKCQFNKKTRGGSALDIIP